MNAFLSEAALTKTESLDELNHHLQVWIEEYYHKNPHYSLGGISPATAFRTDTRPLTFIDAAKCAEAFLHTAEREVDKTGCISFDGKKYEAGLPLMGRKVDVCYDPSWTGEVEIHHKDFVPFKVKELEIGTDCGLRAELPEGLQTLNTDSSRLLDGLNKANITNRTNSVIATSFRKVKEVQSHV